MNNDYVFVLMESEMHEDFEGTQLRGIFTDRYSAEEAMKKLKEASDPDVFSYWVNIEYLNRIIRG